MVRIVKLSVGEYRRPKRSVNDGDCDYRVGVVFSTFLVVGRPTVQVQVGYRYCKE